MGSGKDVTIRRGQRERRGIYFWRATDGAWRSSAESSGSPTLAEHVNDYSQAADELEAKYQEARLPSKACSSELLAMS